MALTERDLEDLDPLRVDREIRALSPAFRRSVRLLRRGRGEDEDPFLGYRLVAGRSLFRAVTDLPPADPLRQPLRRFVYRLAEERIQWRAQGAVAHERHVTERRIDEPLHERLPLSHILLQALGDRPRRAAWLRAYLRHAEALGVAESWLWERRQEIALRMGETSPDAIELPCGEVAGVAKRFLERTRELFDEIRTETLAELLDVALAPGASEGFPGRLTSDTVLSLFRETDFRRSLDLDPGELPPALAPTSLVRALRRLGGAWVDATAPTHQPFVVAHDPYGLRRRTMGALLGALPFSPTFLRRALSVDPSRVRGHRRALGAAGLLAARIAAMRVLLRAPALSGRSALQSAFEESTHDAVGVALAPRVAGALFRLHPDDGQRFSGTLLAAVRSARLRDVHDEDWYRNPRAMEELRDEALLSPEPHTDERSLESGASELIAGLESALA